MPKYKVETFPLTTAQGELDVLVSDGWKPILMSTTSTSPNGETPIAITIMLEKLES
jgi:hypothetical protein